MKRVVGTAFVCSWAASVVLLACSSSGIGGSITASGTSDGGANDGVAPGGPVTIEASCQTYAAAYCNKINSCSAPLFAGAYGDIGTCTARVGLGCHYELTAQGTGATNDTETACANALPAVSCDDIWAGFLPAACQEKGTLADGAACLHDAQCTNGKCAYGDFDNCGHCAAPKKAGDTCSANECDTGLTCSLAKCVVPAKTGEPCDDQTDTQNVGHFCVLSLGCVNHVCGPPQTAGNACKGEGVCDLFKGDYCDQNKEKCTAAVYGAPGTPCGGASADGTTQACGTSGRCVSGTCVAAGTAGAKCIDPSQCLSPSVCVGGTCQDLSAPQCK